MITEKVTSFYDEMKTTDKCTFAVGQLQNFKERAAGDIKMECSSY
jgi:hypothetical protein